ncbi:MAG: NAD(P)-binding domain-containing protein [Bacteroidota bacterium]
MKIAVLGSRMVGRTIASKLHELGHEVSIGTRNVANTLANEQADNYGNPPFKVWHADKGEIQLKTFSDAAAEAEVIINCTSGMASLQALELAGEAHLADKPLIDIANPLDFSNGMPPSLNPVNTDSLAEQIQAKFPAAKVVKTLNTMNAYVMVNPSMIQGDHNVFVSGNDAEAKAVTKSILQSFGWQEHLILDLGDITTARGTEMLLPVWLRLWSALGTAEFNFHIQRKS